MATDIPLISDTSRWTPTQAAKLLGVSTETIRRYRVSGNLRAKVSRVNGRYFFTGRELKRFFSCL